MRPAPALFALAALLLPATALADDYPRRPAELFLGLGFGNAVCDSSKADSSCPVNGGAAFTLGGDWRPHPHWALGGEISAWSYKVRDSWRGQLGTGPQSDVKLSSAYIGPFGRWYWFGDGGVDAYLQFGLAAASFDGTVSNATGTYEIHVTGIAYPLGIGSEWYLSSRFRLGGQALAYLQKSSKVCEKLNGTETCRDATSDQNALPWRILLMGTFLLGDP